MQHIPPSLPLFLPPSFPPFLNHSLLPFLPPLLTIFVSYDPYTGHEDDLENENGQPEDLDSSSDEGSMVRVRARVSRAIDDIISSPTHLLGAPVPV